MTDDLAAFIAARLDEDEAAAKALLEDPDYAGEWHEQSSGVLYVGPGSERYPLDGLQPLGDSRLTRFIARHDPARVLREVTSLRLILFMANKFKTQDRAYLNLLLADIWSDHPDYRAEWKP